MPARFGIILICALAALPARAESVLRDDFEGPEPCLREAGGDARYKVDLHRRVAQGARSGRVCEQLRITGNNGTYVYFGRPITSARIINELSPAVWLKSDRAGLQVLVRAVLPRTTDPQTGKPLTTLLRGSDYRQVGIWQQLRVEGLPRLLERQVRVLRTQFGAQVDAREAYIDMLLINAYGGPGTTNVWVDDLEIGGVVSHAANLLAGETAGSADGHTAQPAVPMAAWPGGQGVPRVELKGRMLLVGGKPFFLRAIEFRGESLARLQSLGFNAVRLPQSPSPAMLSEATGLGLWLIAPPPPARQLESRPGDPSPPRIDSSYDAVLMWDLGSYLAKRELEITKRWAELTTAADPRNRPIACDPDSDLAAYTRLADVLIARRDPIGSTLPLDQYGVWLRDRSRLARGGTPLVATIQTDLPPKLFEQMGLLASGPGAPMVVEEAQLRMLIHTALAARARGVCFASNSRLDAEDAATERRAQILELTNLYLSLIERWPAAGNFAPSASSSDPYTTGAVIETDRSRLLLPIYAPPNGQLAVGNPALKDLRFVVPGVPEGNNAYELSPTSFRALQSTRIAGGTVVTLTEAERDSVVVFTQDAVVYQNLSDRLARIQLRATQLTGDVVRAELSEVESAMQRLAAVGQAIAATQKPLAAAQQDLRDSDAARKSDGPKAYALARKAQQTLRDIQRAHWNQAVAATDWPLADPFVGHFANLSEHFRLMHELASAEPSANRLAEGGFENLEAMQRAGWKYYQHDQPGLTTSVDLAPQAAHSGRVGLRLRVAPDPASKPNVVETPPLWITSPAVIVRPGEIVLIEGWLRIDQAITGSVDGLMVIDSLGGEALAGRVSVAAEWRKFTLYRAAARTGPVVVTFALSGLGEAWIDDVTVQVVSRGARPPLAQPALPMAAASRP